MGRDGDSKNKEHIAAIVTLDNLFAIIVGLPKRDTVLLRHILALGKHFHMGDHLRRHILRHEHHLHQHHMFLEKVTVVIIISSPSFPGCKPSQQRALVQAGSLWKAELPSPMSTRCTAPPDQCQFLFFMALLADMAIMMVYNRGVQHKTVVNSTAAPTTLLCNLCWGQHGQENLKQTAWISHLYQAWPEPLNCSEPHYENLGRKVRFYAQLRLMTSGGN